MSTYIVPPKAIICACRLFRPLCVDSNRSSLISVTRTSPLTTAELRRRCFVPSGLFVGPRSGEGVLYASGPFSTSDAGAMVVLCCAVLCFGKPKKAEAVHTHATITIVREGGGEGEREAKRREKEDHRLQIPRQRILRAGQYIPIHPSTYI